MVRHEKVYIKNVKRKLKKGISVSDEEIAAFSEYQIKKRIREEKIIGVCSWLSFCLAIISIIYHVIVKL